jgi:hypothetical protein
LPAYPAERSKIFIKKEARIADQWEMCVIDVYNIYFCTPKEAEMISIVQYIQRHPQQIFKKEQAAGDKYWVAIKLLLFDSWEPYSGDGHTRSFRRKYQG